LLGQNTSSDKEEGKAEEEPDHLSYVHRMRSSSIEGGPGLRQIGGEIKKAYVRKGVERGELRGLKLVFHVQLL